MTAPSFSTKAADGQWPPGIHHVISRSFKDFVCRLKTCRISGPSKGRMGHPRLPVEIEIEKELGIQNKDQIEAYGVDRFNQKCRESVFDTWANGTK